eukprot:3699543-Rhodomonas_salina.4
MLPCWLGESHRVRAAVGLLCAVEDRCLLSARVRRAFCRVLPAPRGCGPLAGKRGAAICV